jgi:hypothetical protein
MADDATLMASVLRHYSDNPLVVKLVAHTIQELDAGDGAD